MKTLAPTETADEVVTSSATVRAQLDVARAERAAMQGTLDREADAVARLAAVGADPTKAEQAAAKTRERLAALDTRIAGQERLVVSTEAIEATKAGAAAKLDADERKKAAEAAFADARSRLVCSLKGATLDLADCAMQHGLAQVACADLGPGTGGGTADFSSWFAQSQLLDEVWTAACSAAGATGESHRVQLVLRVPELRGA